MSDAAGHNQSSAFGRAFLPGLILGLVVGALAGAFLPDFLTGGNAPNYEGTAGSHAGSAADPREVELTELQRIEQAAAEAGMTVEEYAQQLQDEAAGAVEDGSDAAGEMVDDALEAAGDAVEEATSSQP
ncbi:MAG: hypothetical protein AAF995_05845 [Planctomycetota bacterium]